jgi:hypothetical protein
MFVQASLAEEAAMIPARLLLEPAQASLAAVVALFPLRLEL